MSFYLFTNLSHKNKVLLTCHGSHHTKVAANDIIGSPLGNKGIKREVLISRMDKG